MIVTIKNAPVFEVDGKCYTDPYEAAVAALMPACRAVHPDSFMRTQLAYALASKPEGRAALLKALDEVDKIMDQAKPAGAADVPF